MPAEVLAVVQGQGLGLDQRLGEGLGFGWCLRRHLGFGLRLRRRCLRVRLRERLHESLRFGLGVRGLGEGLGERRWRLRLDVGLRFGCCRWRLLCERFGESLRRLDGGVLLLLWLRLAA